MIPIMANLLMRLVVVVFADFIEDRFPRLGVCGLK